MSGQSASTASADQRPMGGRPAGRTVVLAGAVVVAITAFVFLGASPGPPPAAAEMTVRRDVSYDLGRPPAPVSDLERRQLDVYAAADAVGQPVVVWVHGGAWMRGDKSNQMAHKPDLFVGAGYVFVSINYRLSPSPPTPGAPGRVMFPDHPEDVGEAIAWVHRNIAEYGGDPDRLLLVGHSAGAHLIGLVASDHRYLEAHEVPIDVVRAAVLLDLDAFDIEESMARDPDSIGSVALRNAFGSAAEEQLRPRWELASPAHHADAARAPFLLVTQEGHETRIERNRRFAGSLPPGSDVLLVDKNHAEINGHLGDPTDDSALTVTVLEFLDDHAYRAAG